MGEAIEIALVLTARDLASHVVGGLKAKFDELGTGGKLAVSGITAVAAAATAVIGGLTTMAESSAAAAGEVRKLARETGLTAEEASKLRFAGEKLGVDTDQISKAMGLLSKNLETAHPKLAQYGIEISRNAAGNVDMTATLGNIAERFKSMPDGVEKTALALQIFGRSGKDMIPLLNQGKDGLKELGDEAARMGLVFDDKGLAAAKRFTFAQKELKEEIEGVKNRIGMAVIPVFADFFHMLVQLGDRAMPMVTGAIQRFKDILSPVVGIVRDVVAALQGTQRGGGDFLNAILGPDGGMAVMKFFEQIGGLVRAFGDAIKKAFSGDIVGALKTALGAFNDFRGFVITTIVGALPGILAAFSSWASAAADWVTKDALPKLTAALPGLLRGLVAFITDNTDKVLFALTSWGNKFVFFIAQALPPMMTEAIKLLTTMLDWIVANAPMVLAKLQQWGLQFVAFVVDAIPLLLDAALDMLGQLLGWIADHSEEIGTTLVQWAGKFGEFIIQAAGMILQNLPYIIATIGAWVINTGIPAGIKIFVGLANALSRGLLEGLGNLRDLLHEALVSALQGAIASIDFWVGPFHISGTGGISYQGPGIDIGSLFHGSAPDLSGNAAAAVQGYATGFSGMVTQPTLMRVADAGPEYVSVTPYGGRPPGGGGETYNMSVNINGGFVNDDTVRQMADALQSLMTTAARRAGISGEALAR